MRKVRRVPGWQVVVAGVLTANCRFVEEDDAYVHDRAQVLSGDTARYRDAGTRSRDDHVPRCDDPRRCGPHAGTKAGSSGGADGSAGSRHEGGAAGSRQHGGAGGSRLDGGAAGAPNCDDAGVAPSDAGSCPESAEFAASCSGALRCGPYDGPLHADCSWTCCGKPVSYTVPLRTIAECVRGHWAFSTDPGASTDPCSEPHPCTCSAE
ncbi:MAG TPA: hypothetical protein VJV78_20730 [Polyangiales bacterium]|nr:hypothetical protein [Polyangiales bacterium]